MTRDLRPSWRTFGRLAVGVIALAAVIALALTIYPRIRPSPWKPLAHPEVSINPRMQDLHDPGDKPLTIQLKGVATDNGQFVAIPAVIYKSKNRINQMKQAVLAYLGGPRQGRVQVSVPPGMVLNELYLSPDGTAVVDLSLSTADPSAFGFWEETLFVRGLLFALNNHFPDIRRVRLLMDDKESDTLAGHYALGFPASSYARHLEVAEPTE